MTEQITVPRETWDALLGALETCTYTSSYDKSFDIVKVEEALTAAKAVLSHQKPETTQPPEGGAITLESAAALYEQAFGVKLTDSAQIGGVLRLCNLAAKAVQPQAQEGWKWVPVEPAKEMLVALMCTGLRNVEYLDGRSPLLREMAQGYTAMLAAAPAPKEEA